MQGPFLCAHSFETKANRVDDKGVRGREGRQPMDSYEQTPLEVGEGGAGDSTYQGSNGHAWMKSVHVSPEVHF